MVLVRGLAVFSGIILFFTINAFPQDSASFSQPLWTVTEMLICGGHDAEATFMAETQSAPLPRAYALLGVATALIYKKPEAAHYFLNSSP